MEKKRSNEKVKYKKSENLVAHAGLVPKVSGPHCVKSEKLEIWIFEKFGK